MAGSSEKPLGPEVPSSLDNGDSPTKKVEKKPLVAISEGEETESITGALYDTLGDYDAGFYFAGTMIFISGAMLFAIPVLQRKLERKKPTFDITSGKGQDDEFVPDA